MEIGTRSSALEAHAKSCPYRGARPRIMILNHFEFWSVALWRAFTSTPSGRRTVMGLDTPNMHTKTLLRQTLACSYIFLSWWRRQHHAKGSRASSTTQKEGNGSTTPEGKERHTPNEEGKKAAPDDGNFSTSQEGGRQQHRTDRSCWCVSVIPA